MDPLAHLIQVSPPDAAKVERIIVGEIYTAVVLKGGDIGVCANLAATGSRDSFCFSSPDLTDQSVRILLIAFYNAFFNPSIQPDAFTDIYTHIDFRNKGNITMIGNFRPLVAKFDLARIPLKIFDLKADDERLEPYSELEAALPLTSTLIITSTTLVNNTYPGIMEKLSPSAKAFLLGPSGIMHESLFHYPQLKAIYGMKFQPADNRVLEVIMNNGGTPNFSKFSQKVCLLKKKSK